MLSEISAKRNKQLHFKHFVGVTYGNLGSPYEFAQHLAQQSGQSPHLCFSYFNYIVFINFYQFYLKI